MRGIRGVRGMLVALVVWPALGCGGDDGQPGPDATDGGLDGGGGDDAVSPGPGRDGGGLVPGTDAAPIATPAMTGFAQISIGIHSCGLKTDGTAWCWGDNELGQLGDGSTIDRTWPSPVLVAPDGPPLTDLVEIKVGARHTCARKTAGTVLCWGFGGASSTRAADGSLLADGTVGMDRANRPSPTSVLTAPGGPPLSDVTQLAPGSEHACALKTDGTVVCWGSNQAGEIGDGTTLMGRNSPTQVLVAPGGAPLGGVASIHAGHRSTCARMMDGSVNCWGDNAAGQLGDGTMTARAVPGPVLAGPGGPPLSGITSLAMRNLSVCATKGDGTALCWGRRLHLIGTPIMPLPTPVTAAPGGAPIDGVASATPGYAHGCLRKADGTAACWGFNQSGEAGDGTRSERLSPTPVLRAPGGPPLTDVVELEAGNKYSCARLADTTVVCWGENGGGALGTGTKAMALSPGPVREPPPVAARAKVSAISAGGGGNTCALTPAGTAYCWGHNTFGEVGDGTRVERLVPSTVLAAPSVPLTELLKVDVGANHSCALKADQTVLCWGYTGYRIANPGMGMVGTSLPLPPLAADGTPVGNAVELAVSDMHSCVLRTDGTAVCWGANGWGQLGDGMEVDFRPFAAPVLAAAGGPLQHDLAQIVPGGAGTCALKKDGNVMCWGSDGVQLGTGMPGNQRVPAWVLASPGVPLDDVKAITRGGNHTCALRGNGGAVLCWGDNRKGQLGDGATMARGFPSPVLVGNTGNALSGVAQIVAAAERTCARTTAGTAYCWGDQGPGDGTATGRLTATPVLAAYGGAPMTDIADISVGTSHACVVKTNGVALCWGFNSTGQLGEGTKVARSSPAVVLLP